MDVRNGWVVGAATAASLLAACSTTQIGGSKGMSFFVTSVGSGKGGDLGGLAGADQHCQALAKAAGAGDLTWRAYLSTQSSALSDPNAVNARDRIGSGPWHNAKGELIAANVDELHSGKSNLNRQTALTEKGGTVNARGQTPLQHDILTGSRPDGTAFPSTPFPDMTCGNWTKSGKDGAAIVGHHDIAGPSNFPWATSWNSSHPTLGCGLENLRPTGGEGYFYCFAAQ